MSNLKRTALASAMVSVLVMGAVTTAYSETSTKSGDFTVDITTVTAGSKINLSILGLNAEGAVDTEGELHGSVIEAQVTSQRGEVEGAQTKGCFGLSSQFEADVDGGTTRYIKLDSGIGKTNIYYPPELSGSDTVSITLHECINPNDDGGLTVNHIDKDTKSITILPADPTVKMLDITSFTGGDGNDGIDEAGNDIGDGMIGGVDGVVTAGKDGAQVKIVAYKRVEEVDMEYTFGSTSARPTVKGVTLVEVAYGQVTLELRPKKDAAVKMNRASESIILTGDMVKGIAFVSLPGIDVTQAGKYYLEATLEGYDDLSSVDMYNDDTVTIEPVVSEKLSLKSEKKTISDLNTDASGTKLTACMVDKYGNKTEANTAMDVLITDEGGDINVSATAVKFRFNSGDICKTDITSVPKDDSILGNYNPNPDTEGDEVIEPGIAFLVAHEDQNRVSESDGEEVKIAERQLGSSKLLINAPTKAGTSIVPAFDVFDDVNGNGVFDAGDKFVNDLSITRMTIRHYSVEGWLIEETSAMLDATSRSLAVNFSVVANGAAKSGPGEYYIIGDENGDFGEVIALEGVAGTADIVHASASVCEHVNGHGLTFDSMNAIWNSTKDELYGAREPAMEAFLGENNLKLYDALGNQTTPARVVLTSPNAAQILYEGAPVDYRANDPYGNATSTHMALIAYDETFVGDDEVAFEFINDPAVTCDPVTVTVHEIRKLETIKIEVESTTIPLNGEIPVRITSWDQNGELFVPETELELDIDGAVALNVELRYVHDDGSENPELRSGEKIPLSANGEQGGRSVLVIKTRSETGTFQLEVHDGDFDGSEGVSEGVSSGFMEFTVATAQQAATTEETCIAEGHVWVDDECQKLPTTSNEGTGKSGVMKADGTFSFTSEAQFSGGWILKTDDELLADAGDYINPATYNGEEVTLAFVIRFSPAHVGEIVDIVVPLMIILDPPFSPYPPFWFQVSGTYGITSWDMTTALYDEDAETGLSGYMSHEIVEGEPLVLGPYALGVLEDFPKAIVDFYLGYRLESGDTHFGAIPVKLTTP